MADSTSKLLERQGANAISAPSMQEVPLYSHTAVFGFAQQLFDGEVDILVYMTGVGTDMLVKTMKTKYKLDDILQALEGIIVVSRGSKPAKVLRGLDVTIDIKVPEPNTREEILNALDEHARTSDLTGKK